ncbi:MAG: PAN domain-containing protein [Robiginitomaculum sp.]|nr:PAN domain-containing protein [Robiginitomaculum sp.]
MCRISIITTTLALALLTPTTSSAADQYTYRAGQAYMKSTASNHLECEAQCRGDAACRGWNFVRPSPRSRSGICEFNARKAVPVSSPVSISGEINTGIDALMSHAVPLTNRGGNTVRVGTPIVPKRVIPKRRIAAAKVVNAPAPATRRIVKRMPVPGAAQAVAPADYKRTIPAQRAVAPIDMRVERGLRMPQSQQQQPMQQPRQQIGLQQLQTGPIISRQMTRAQIYREQMQAAQIRDAQRAGGAQAQITARQNLPQQNIYAPSQNIQTQPQQVRQQLAQQAPQQLPAPIQRQAVSLYGSLHDDLTQNMTVVPRPQTAPDQIENPDAPVSTSRAVPTKPVQAEPLGYPAIPGLAGG